MDFVIRKLEKNYFRIEMIDFGNHVGEWWNLEEKDMKELSRKLKEAGF